LKNNLRVFITPLFATDLQLDKKFTPQMETEKSIRNTSHDATIPQNLVKTTNYSG
jgi:hypothetical protein